MSQTIGIESLPPAPFARRRTRAELAVLVDSLSGNEMAGAMLERMERNRRHQAARDARTTPETKARKAAMDRCRKLAKVRAAADEATRYVAALRLLDAMPMEIDPLERRAAQLRANVEAGTAKVRALAAAGCEVCKAFLSNHPAVSFQ